MALTYKQTCLMSMPLKRYATNLAIELSHALLVRLTKIIGMATINNTSSSPKSTCNRGKASKPSRLDDNTPLSTRRTAFYATSQHRFSKTRKYHKQTTAITCNTSLRLRPTTSTWKHVRKAVVGNRLLTRTCLPISLFLTK